MSACTLLRIELSRLWNHPNPENQTPTLEPQKIEPLTSTVRPKPQARRFTKPFTPTRKLNMAHTSDTYRHLYIYILYRKVQNHPSRPFHSLSISLFLSLCLYIYRNIYIYVIYRCMPLCMLHRCFSMCRSIYYLILDLLMYQSTCPHVTYLLVYLIIICQSLFAYVAFVCLILSCRAFAV